MMRNAIGDPEKDYQWDMLPVDEYRGAARLMIPNLYLPCPNIGWYDSQRSD